jgi:hypothetical protein
MTAKTQIQPVIMNAQQINQTLTQKKQQSASRAERPNHSEFISIPIGSFAGTLERIIRIRDGQPVPADTGDQGGGQN